MVSDEERLFRAIRSGDQQQVKHLIGAGIDVESCKSEGLSPVHVAVMRQQPAAMILTLLGAGCDVNAKDRDGKTALRWACDLDLLSHIELLLESGAQVDVYDNVGATAKLPALLLADRLDGRSGTSPEQSSRRR